MKYHTAEEAVWKLRYQRLGVFQPQGAGLRSIRHQPLPAAWSVPISLIFATLSVLRGQRPDAVTQLTVPGAQRPDAVTQLAVPGAQRPDALTQLAVPGGQRPDTDTAALQYGAPSDRMPTFVIDWQFQVAGMRHIEC